MNTISFHTTLPESLSGLRLDLALAQLLPEYSRSRIQSWISNNQVWVDGKPQRSKNKIYAQQVVEVQADIPIANTTWVAQPIALDILYADQHLIILNKPVGLVAHPAPGNPDHTLVNALLNYDPALAMLPRAGLVHRLDKDTSGIMVVARNLQTHSYLVTQIQNRAVKREYLTVVSGQVTAGSTIDASIGRHKTQRLKMAVTDSGKPAITHYRLIERFRAHTYLRVFLETGRTHQIRVHMAHIGYPIVGDPLYGGRQKLPAGCSETLKATLIAFKRQALHAHRLTLAHPHSHDMMHWEAPLPDDFKNLLHDLK